MWNKEYEIFTKEYQELFDKSMRKNQESNVEFLEDNLSNMFGRNVVVCNSGTDALFFSLLKIGVGKGDEVLTTNFSWISTASVISMAGLSLIHI